jgi:triosephosphate isomerase
MKKPFIAANWKMNKTVRESIAFAKRLAEEFSESCDRDIVIAPPFTSLYPLHEILDRSPIGMAAQNMYWEEKGAYTGEISAEMIVDAGCEYVIIGHSERRSLFGESNEHTNKKIKTALAFGLRPIFCVGETLTEREAGSTFNIVEKQLKDGLNNILSDDIRRIIVAYEPVWAIGTGRTATAEQAKDVHGFIRKVIGDKLGSKSSEEIAIIYGGSVNRQNINDLMSQPEIDGVLVGGASLDFESFVDIVRF